jgi:hypothetical protein
MRLVKDTQSKNSKLFEISEHEYLFRKRMSREKNIEFSLVQYCDLPKKKNKPTKVYHKLNKIEWDSVFLLSVLITFKKAKLNNLCREFIYQLSLKDDKKWKWKGKQKLVKYILELAYQAGYTNGQTVYHNSINKESKEDEQNTSKKIDKPKQPRGRKKTKVPKED